MSYSLQVTEQTNGLTLSQNTYTLELSTGIDPTAQRGAGSPLNVITPAFIGQMYIDTNQYGSVYIAGSATSSGWIEMVRNF